jgi:hypothetical protein
VGCPPMRSSRSKVHVTEAGSPASPRAGAGPLQSDATKIAIDTVASDIRLGARVVAIAECDYIPC